MRDFLNTIFLGLGAVMISCVLAPPARALSMYSRGAQAPYNTNSPNRFLYTNPFYQKRAAHPKPECKPNGLARCLNPKKPNPFMLTRQNPAMQKVSVHPYLRNIVKPPIQRIN
jgi:hypothetical protein